ALGNTVSGPSSVTLFDLGLGTVSITLNGSVPVPEPSSIGILAGLGLVVGRRVYKRARAAA
ncbi:MAG: PEP-CTERM sorting domain-containing protein, partial [Planctomyces sp.]